MQREVISSSFAISSLWEGYPHQGTVTILNAIPQCLRQMWHIFSLGEKWSDRFSGVEIPRGTVSIKTVAKIKDLMARSRGTHSTCNMYIFPVCRITLAGGSVSPALPVLLCYRQKEGYESGQSPCSCEFHTAVGYSFSSGKVNVVHTEMCFYQGQLIVYF